MTREQVRELIAAGQPSDWVEDHWMGARPSQHPWRATNRDTRVVLLWGKELEHNYEADWLADWWNPTNRLQLLEIQFEGKTIESIEFAMVDAGRCYVPVPAYEDVPDHLQAEGVTGYWISRELYDIFDVVNEVAADRVPGQEFADYVSHAAIAVRD